MGEDHREYLKGLIEFRFYKNYIDQHLAGDFAYDLAQLIRDKNLLIREAEGKNKDLEAQLEDYRQCFVNATEQTNN